VIAFDGQTYSNNSIFTYFHVNVAPNHAPVVTIPSANVSASAGQTIAASSLFSVTDADNDVLTYFLYDGTANGSRFVVNGVTVAAQTVVALSAFDLAHTTVVAGPLGSSDDLSVLAYDGHAYSGASFSHFHVNVVSPAGAASPAASATEGDNFVFAQGLGQKGAMELGQGIANLSADHFNQVFGAVMVASIDTKADSGVLPEATLDPLALFGLHATEHFAF
jgi:hypothetical protein